MYHIVKTKSAKRPFQVVLIGENGEVLLTSQLFSSKDAAFKNIAASNEATANFYAYVQDDTVRDKVPSLWRVYGWSHKEKLNKEKMYDLEMIKPRYISGKNPSQKSKKG